MTRLLVLMLAAAAAASTASAADLPSRTAAPVDYLRVCDAFGAGFFYIPGTDTCLRVGGQIRGEYSFRGKAPTDNPLAVSYNASGQSYRRDLTNFRARAYVNLDSRTQTAYGALRAFVSLRITQDTTAPGPSGGGREPAAVAAAGGRTVTESTGAFQGLAPNQAQPVLDKGFIQFAGFTAGRAQSFFDFDAQSYELLTNTIANSNQVTELFAYTGTFGKGFSATISVEDARERQIGDSGLYQNGGTIGGVAFVSTQEPNATRAGYLAYGGEHIPDIVGNVRYDADWGSAQLSGAYHELRSQQVTLAAATPAGPRGKTLTPPSEDGFAVLGGVKVLTPFIAKGDSVTVQGTYQSGAMDYINPIDYQPVGFSNVYDNNTVVGVPVNDAFVSPNGRIVKSSAYGGYAAFRHYYIADVYSSLFGDYARIRNPVSAQFLGAGADNARIYQIGFNTVWTPVKDFQIGAEVLYSNLLLTGKTVLIDNPISGTAPRNPDDYRARLSFRRAF